MDKVIGEIKVVQLVNKFETGYFKIPKFVELDTVDWDDNKKLSLLRSLKFNSPMGQIVIAELDSKEISDSRLKTSGSLGKLKVYSVDTVTEYLIDGYQRLLVFAEIFLGDKANIKYDISTGRFAISDENNLKQIPISRLINTEKFYEAKSMCEIQDEEDSLVRVATAVCQHTISLVRIYDIVPVMSIGLRRALNGVQIS